MPFITLINPENGISIIRSEFIVSIKAHDKLGGSAIYLQGVNHPYHDQRDPEAILQLISDLERPLYMLHTAIEGV